MQAFENACKQTQNSNLNSRQEAENYLKTLRTSASVPLLKQVLETSLESIAQFHSAVILKDIIALNIKNYDEKYNLTHYLVLFVVERFDSLLHHVRNAILQAIAVSTKLGWNDVHDRTRTDVMDFLLTQNQGKKRLCLYLMQSLLNEFQSLKATQLGLALDFHQSCQVSFQKTYLISLFQMVLQCIHESMNEESNPDIVLLAISCAEKILSWDFKTGTALMQSKEDVYLEKEKAPLRLPKNWEVVLAAPAVVQLFFQLSYQYWDHSSISARLNTCLVQLSSVNGSVFDTHGLKSQYFANFITQYGIYVKQIYSRLSRNSPVDLGDKIFGLSQIGKHILKLPLELLTQVSTHLELIKDLTRITIDCLNFKLGNLDDTWFLDAADELLLMWSLLVESIIFRSKEEIQVLSTQPAVGNFFELLSKACSEIVSIYVDTHVVSSPIDDDDFGDKDVDVFADQLMNIGMLARLKPLAVLEKLRRIFDEKHRLLLELINNPRSENQNSIMVLQEQIHWGVLITGHLLADSGFGETPLIPENIMSLSSCSNNCDLVTLIPTKVFSILDSLTFPISSQQHFLCSPLLMETLFWFLDRWSGTYLFVDPTNYSSMSHNIINAFGNPNGTQILNFILEKVFDHVRVWQNETDIILQIISVLQGLSKKKTARDEMVANQRFTQIVEYFLTDISLLPSDSHSSIVQTIAYIATHCTDEQSRNTYFRSLGDSIENSLNLIVHDPNFSKTYQSTSTREGIIVVLEMFQGLALSVDELTTVAIFETCARHFGTFLKLLELYDSYPDLELYLIRILRDLIKNQYFDALDSRHHQLLYQTVHDIIQIYAKNEVGRHRSASSVEEEDLFEDLSTLLEMLSGLITSEYEGFERETVLARIQKSQHEIDVARVVFVGVNSLIPLITKEMLQFPRLCLDYMHLVGLLIEYFPDKLYSLPVSLLNSLVQSLLYGTQQAIGRIPDYSFKAIQSLALFSWAQSQSNQAQVNHLDGPLDILLTETFQALLLKPLDTSILPEAANCFFALSLSRPATFENLLNSFASQSQNNHILNSSQKLGQIIVDNHSKQLQKLMAGQVTIGWGSPGLERYPSLNSYRKVFQQFILESRNIVLIK